MESLAPAGRRLPSEGKALAIELAGAAEEEKKDLSRKTPEEIYQAANALYEVRPAEQVRPSKQSACTYYIHACQRAISSDVTSNSLYLYILNVLHKRF